MEAAPQSQSTQELVPPLSSAASAGHWSWRSIIFVLPLVAGLILRLQLLKSVFAVNGDTLIYGQLAKSLLLKGSYAFNLGDGAPVPTLSRLPGYPLFLAVCFRFLGIENYLAVVFVQIALELLGCLLLADFAARIVPPNLASGARMATLWLAALCPFTASYAAMPLAESPTLFAISFALWAMARFYQRPGWANALLFTFGVTYTALLRPDGALAAVALAPALVLGLARAKMPSTLTPKKLLRMILVCILLALAPFAIWTTRNWRTFHVFQPLAPRYAQDPDEEIYAGWQSWVKTWCLDFISTYQIYWSVPGSPLDLSKLPGRAFDSPAQYAETAALAAKYNNRDGAADILPDVDAGFGKLATERIATHPLRYYLWLPLGRVADMWMRPRVENLNIDLDWWAYRHHRVETRFSWAYAGLNALYLLLAAIGLILRPRFWTAMLAYILLRSAMLLTVEAPETRYTLECFPMLFVLGGVALYWVTNRVCLSVLKVKASDGSD